MRELSIITVTKNNVTGLRKTLNQVAEIKEILPIEFIVVDGKSIDGTCKVLNENKSIDKWVSEDDNGVYHAMNKGVMMSSGRLIYFLNTGDDLITNEFIRAVEFVRSCTIEAPMLFYFNVFHAEYRTKYCGNQRNIDFLKRNICHQSIIYTKSIFNIVGLFDLKYKCLSDYAHNLKCFGNKSVKKVYCDLTIANYEGGGISSKISDKEFHDDFPKIIKESIGLEYFLLLRIKNIARVVAAAFGVKELIKKSKLNLY